MTQKGVEARQLFYEGTKAYKTGDFGQAAAKFKEGLAIWKDCLKDFPVYRDDDLNKKDTGLIVKRYVRVLQQLGEKLPDNFPFKDLLAAAKADTTSTRSTPSRCSASPRHHRKGPRAGAGSASDALIRSRHSPPAIPTGPGFLRDAGAEISRATCLPIAKSSSTGP